MIDPFSLPLNLSHRQVLEAIEDGTEYEQREIAELVDQKPNNKQFVAVWKRLFEARKIARNATTKKYYKNPTPLPETPVEAT